MFHYQVPPRSNEFNINLENGDKDISTIFQRSSRSISFYLGKNRIVFGKFTLKYTSPIANISIHIFINIRTSVKVNKAPKIKVALRNVT